MLPHARSRSAPTLSVAMCTYNGAAFLRPQLDSILRQTVLPDELVVCDDGSADTTFEVLEDFAGKAPFTVRLLRNPESLGPAQNFARCISLCSGDLILLTDQDDLWSDDRVQQTREAFAANPSATLAYSDAPLIDAHGSSLHRTLYTSLPIRPDDAKRLAQGGDLLSVLNRYSVLCGATMAFRATLLPYALPVPSLWMHDEWIGLVANALGRAIRLPQPVTRYRQHARQQLGTGHWTVATHLRVARSRQAEFYSRELQRLQNGIDAVRVHPDLSSVLLPLFEAKQAFFEDRLRIHQGGLRALPVLTRLLFSGGYARYASGLRSSAKDLAVLLSHALRPGATA